MLVVFVVVGVLPLACAGTETVVFVLVTVVANPMVVVTTGVTDDELLEPVGPAEPVVAPVFVDGAT
jgi:hypothetical protein